MINGTVTDFSGFNNAVTAELAENLMRTHTFRAKRQEDRENGSDRCIKVKVITKLNYVTHVYFTTDESGILQSCSCDGTGQVCGRFFCEHCKAAYVYLKSSQAFLVKLPSEETSEEPAADDGAKGSDTSEEPFAYTEPAVLEEPAANDGSEGSDTSEEPDIFDKPQIEAILNEILQKAEEIRAADEGSEESEEADTSEAAKEPEASKRPALATAPAEVKIRGMQILLGHEKSTGEEVWLRPNDTDLMLNTNIGIIGTMGTGKTQFTKSIVTQLCRSCSDNYDGTPLGILIFDYKGDYNESKPDFIRMTGATVIHPYRMPFNPLSLNLKERNNKALLPNHTANAFKDTLSKIYNLGPKQEGVLFDCIQAAYLKQGIRPADPTTWRRPAPTFRMVYEEYKKSAAFNDNDKLAVVMKKLEGFEIFIDDPMKALPLSQLLKGVTVIDISDYDEDIQNLVVAITLDLFYAQMQTFGSSKTNGKYRQLKTFILVDEADNFMRMNFPSLRKIMKEGREFGVGVILSTQSLTHFCSSDDDYSKYIMTWCIHNVNDLNRRSLEVVLNQSSKSTSLEEWSQAIKNLNKHESVVKISNSEPIVMRDKPFWQLLQEGT